MFKKLSTIILLMSVQLSAQVYINEYSCSNLKNFNDIYQKTEDWIELYNASENEADISGYSLSDRADKPQKWQFPAGSVIAGKGFLLVWASGRDTLTEGEYHTNFRLSQTGDEALLLSDAQGNILEQHALFVTQTEHSYGRQQDGSNAWGIFTAPTLQSSNNDTPFFITYAPKVVFSAAAGRYTDSVTVAMSTSVENTTIRYTTDGSLPDSNAAIYSEPLLISSNTVLKAAAFVDFPTILPGFVEYATYFINESHHLPIISISGSYMLNLVNGDNTLHPVGAFEYFDKDFNLITRAYGEFNSHGKDSWVCDQRAVDFISRDEMGYSAALQHKIFATSDRTEFQRIIIRASGDDNYPCGNNDYNKGSAHMRDGYIHNLAERGDMHLDLRRSERIILYVNGQYWGVYELREIPDEHDYTDYYYKQDKYDLQYILTWGNTWAEYGGDQALSDFSDLRYFILNKDMSDSSNFNQVDSLLNIKSLIDYVLVNSFTVCSDWLNYNTGVWRGLNPKGDHKKWGYILWDNDATFGFYLNYTGIPDTGALADVCNTEILTADWQDPEKHISILNKLLENPSVRTYYINRQNDLLNTVFSCDNMLNYLNTYTALIKPEMERHAQRWYGTYEGWTANVAKLQHFIENRCEVLHQSLNDCYDLTGPFAVTFDQNPRDVGEIQVNSLKISQFPATLQMHGGVVSTITAKPYYDNIGINFQEWQSEFTDFLPTDTSRTVRVNFLQDDMITAQYTNIAGVPQEEWLTAEEGGVAIYPTLTNDKVQVDYFLATQTAAVTIQLLSADGKEVATFRVPSQQGANRTTIDFPKNLPQGMYLLRYTHQQSSKTANIFYFK